jgi:pheromone shutdown protein TraB
MSDGEPVDGEPDDAPESGAPAAEDTDGNGAGEIDNVTIETDADAADAGDDVLEPGETPVRPRKKSGTGSITVVGTAHVSHESVEEVNETIDRERPDIVAVELDETRYKRLKGETPDDLEAGDLISGKTVYQFLAYWMLSYVQARLGDRFDIEPGADMMAAIEAAERNGSGVALVDRDIQLTVRRLWSRVRVREKLTILAALLVEFGGPWTAGLAIGFFFGFTGAIITGVVSGLVFLPAGLGAGISVPLVGGLVGALVSVLDSLVVAGLITMAIGLPVGTLLAAATRDIEDTEIDIEELTDADVVTAMIEEFRQFSPGGAEALIDERDAYIAQRLVALRDAGYDVVAVVGAGHRAGIEHYLDHPEELPAPESLIGETDSGWVGPLVYKALGYTFTLGFLVFFVLLAMAGVRGQFLLTLFVAWFLINGLIAAGLARLAGAHWTSAGVGGAVAWLTSVNPLLAPGWFAGYVELRYMSVNVSDISTLNEMLKDEETPILQLVREMRDDVPLFRLLLIVGMTNIGSIIASILFATVLLPYLASDIGGIGGLSKEMVAGARESARLIWGLVG